LGIIFGHIALSQIKRTGEVGRGLAISGLVIGCIWTPIALLLAIALISSSSQQLTTSRTQSPLSTSTVSTPTADITIANGN
jgi:Domain of unknown function (DUF4190)